MSKKKKKNRFKTRKNAKNRRKFFSILRYLFEIEFILLKSKNRPERKRIAKSCIKNSKNFKNRGTENLLY